jgi:hypothetical protein
MLYLFSYSGATFIEGADASQYYLPALSFLEDGRFMQDNHPLTFGPPLYSIFLSVPIFLFDIEGASSSIVIIQCILLYLTGFLSRKILLQFTNNIKFGLLLHALIVFNPNSIITAHLVQSETLFTFLFIWSVVVAFKLITNFSFKNLIFLGVLTGLATLTRPISLYLLLLWPVFILIALVFNSQFVFNFKRGESWLKLSVIVVIGGLIISPWYIRNYVAFGEVFFTSNAGAYLQAQYIQLKNKGSGYTRTDAKNEHRRIFSDYLADKGESDFCLNNDRHWSCNNDLAQASLSAIVSEPLTVHVKTLINSWGALFFSGGASNIRNYLNFDGKDLIVNFQKNSFNGLESILSLVRDMNLPYLLIFILTTVFSFISRVLGVIGVVFIIKNKEWRSYGLLLIEVVSIFTAAYLYLGQSRFRVPLEPLLMVFTVVGVLYIFKKRKADKWKKLQ